MDNSGPGKKESLWPSGMAQAFIPDALSPVAVSWLSPTFLFSDQFLQVLALPGLAHDQENLEEMATFKQRMML